MGKISIMVCMSLHHPLIWDFPPIHVLSRFRVWYKTEEYIRHPLFRDALSVSAALNEPLCVTVCRFQVCVQHKGSNMAYGQYV